VITLKTELARRLLERDPSRASVELSEVETVARTSLRDVREAVAGYRRVDLDTELAGAAVALEAAGIEVDVRRSPGPLDQATDTVLGWVVREGVTNVIRHSAARHCEIRIEADPREVRIAIIDDGIGPRARERPGAGVGSGLAGIRERVVGLGGRVEARAAPDGGHRLVAVIPARPEIAATGRAATEETR
jgi:two-component system sensor histidine kinase DesK